LPEAGTSIGESLARGEKREKRVFSKFDFPAHVSGVDDTFDTLAVQSIQWRHHFVLGGGISVYWVAELTVFSNIIRTS
jgi:hypothetical protein